ncbi:MAG: (Fe-S)-binding protein [Balneolaceae bacterium]
MIVGLFIPCYIDQFYPRAARATLELLESTGVEVVVPTDQTCCGQPLANSGYEPDAVAVMEQLADTFAGVDHIVSPSGSCIHHIRHHYDILEQSPAVRHLREKSLELCQFLSRHPEMNLPPAHFPFRTGLHQSCHGQRGLRLASSSERMEPAWSVVGDLLKKVEGLELVSLNREDECCGFGGTFAVTEEAVSVRMGKDRVADHLQNDVEVITGTDLSCLMHLEGIIRRDGLPLRVLHVAEILNTTGEQS